MKALYIDTNKCKEIELIDYIKDEAYENLLFEYKLMESPVVYFSVGDAKIKEILIKKDPTFTA